MFYNFVLSYETNREIDVYYNVGVQHSESINKDIRKSWDFNIGIQWDSTSTTTKFRVTGEQTLSKYDEEPTLQNMEFFVFNWVSTYFIRINFFISCTNIFFGWTKFVYVCRYFYSHFFPLFSLGKFFIWFCMYKIYF